MASDCGWICRAGRKPGLSAGAEAEKPWSALEIGLQRLLGFLERHLAPIYTLATQAGIQDRQQALQHFQSMELTSIEMGELQVKPQGADMVVSYIATLQTKSSAAPQRYFMTTVWQQAKSGWIAIAHSEVPAQPITE